MTEPLKKALRAIGKGLALAAAGVLGFLLGRWIRPPKAPGAPEVIPPPMATIEKEIEDARVDTEARVKEEVLSAPPADIVASLPCDSRDAIAAIKSGTVARIIDRLRGRPAGGR